MARLLVLLLLVPSIAHAAVPTDNNDFLREDWTLVIEPTHLNYWGTRLTYERSRDFMTGFYHCILPKVAPPFGRNTLTAFLSWHARREGS